MQLYEPAHDRLSRFVQTLVWNTDDAKDVISETALIAFEQFDAIREKEKFVFYLFSVAANVLKKKQRRQRFWGFFSVDEADQLEGNQSTDANLLRRELYKALQKLPHKQQEAIVLFDISGFSIKEIAAMQQLSESGVKSNLRRGKEKLAQLLTEKPNESYDFDKLQIERSRYGK